MELIELKNIDLTGWNGLDQCEKIGEEIKEFYEATAEYLHNNKQEFKDHAIEEYFDTLQSCLGLLAIAGITAEEVMKEYPKHLNKLKHRPRIKRCDKCTNCIMESKQYAGDKTDVKYIICNKMNEKIEEKDLKHYANKCGYYKEGDK
ncbi:hypothetical protein CLSAB_19050 [Clostridium saccharobutylicum]|uniref:hypothetical protein n=1 Tax=Clostridium saccharobutylicum TaxID=169679 RepID=UPI00098CC8E7|nr:hypothetical protein [Clostridium saccharobutylicum]OOM17185.1 hypothetical protein CLSAB_19050 [Clostridium saccharobutylicum]